MSTIDDKLNEVLGIAEDVTYENEVPKQPSTQLTVPEDKDPDIDFETGRKNLYNLLDKGNEAIDGIRERFGGDAIGPGSTLGSTGVRPKKKGSQQWGPQKND